MQKIKNLILITMLSILTVFTSSVFAATTNVDKNHEQLRELRSAAAKAMSDANFTTLTGLLSKQFDLITVDNQKFSNMDEFKNYWEKTFVNGSMKISKIDVDPEADALTNFIAPDVGIVDGTSNDTYHFSDGDVRKMKTRWSAVVLKESGAWKIRSIHFSANLLDNPVLQASKNSLYTFATIALIVGLILGAITSFAFKRK